MRFLAEKSSMRPKASQLSLRGDLAPAGERGAAFPVWCGRLALPLGLTLLA
jgi:hypothetical protein